MCAHSLYKKTKNNITCYYTKDVFPWVINARFCDAKEIGRAMGGIKESQRFYRSC